MQQLAALGVGVGDQADAQLLRRGPQQMADQRRLAGADLAGDQVIGANVARPYSSIA